MLLGKGPILLTGLCLEAGAEDRQPCQPEGYPGDIAQLGERGVRNAEVGGSSPPISTNLPL